MWTLSLPNEYSYVLAVASSTFVVNMYHVILTSKARKQAGIKYPAAYASNEQADKDPKAYAFNCAQRAHANFTETLTPFLAALLISGLRFPQASAGLGAGWIVARLAYARGYTSSGPAGRALGATFNAIFGGVLGLTSLFTSAMFVLEK